MTEKAWKSFEEEKPTNEGLYWWKLNDIELGGMNVSPMWTDKYAEMNCGYDKEMWPEFSDWNGYKRSVPEGLYWMSAKTDEKDRRILPIIIKPCPFCGTAQKISSLEKHGGGVVVNSRLYNHNTFWIKCTHCGCSSTPHFNDLNKLTRLWNKRS